MIKKRKKEAHEKAVAEAEEWAKNSIPPPKPRPPSPEEMTKMLDEELKRGMSFTLVENQPDIPSLTCSICLELMKDPVLHSACGNLFCAKCIKDVSQCPLCRGTLDANSFVPAPKMVTNKIASIKVSCDRCHTTMSLEAFNERHKNTCWFSCPFQCGSTVPFSAFERHCKGGACSKFVVKCPGWIAPLNCEWHGFGGPDYREHVANCQYAKIVPYVNQTDNTIAELKSTVAALQATVATLQGTIDNLKASVQSLNPPVPLPKEEKEEKDDKQEEEEKEKEKEKEIEEEKQEQKRSPSSGCI